MRSMCVLSFVVVLNKNILVVLMLFNTIGRSSQLLTQGNLHDTQYPNAYVMPLEREGLGAGVTSAGKHL